VAQARTATLNVNYNNKNISADLRRFLIGFSYSDYSNGKADDLQINLDDKEDLWKASWFPEKGATLTAEIITRNWNYEGEVQRLPLGQFEIDDIDLQGPPDVVTIKGVSVPVSSSLWDEDKNRAWENTRLSIVASDIASGSGLELFFDTEYDAEYDRIEQTEETDIAFLQRLCEEAGISLKVTNKTIIIFDDSKYEQQEPVATITRGSSNVISYSGNSKTRDIYSACRVEYQASDKKEPIIYTYTPPNGPKVGRTLVINERVSSYSEAERLAKKSLREKNKEETTFNVKLSGDVRFVSGVTVNLKGWGRFDGKYFITEAKHEGGSAGYTTELELRRVLEGY